MEENKVASAGLYQPLPKESLPEGETLFIDAEGQEYFEKYIKSTLPGSDQINLNRELTWNFLLAKHGMLNKKPLRAKHKLLTRKSRKKLNLLKLPKNNWKYESLEGLRVMWRSYMHSNLAEFEPTLKPGDPEWASLSMVVTRCELIGAEMKVVRSKVPSQVGISGTVVLETKMTFQLVTKNNGLKIILKESSVFEIQVSDWKCTIFGKHLMVRPNERSVKKIKSFVLPDL